MKKITLVLVWLALSSNLCLAQTPTFAWAKKADYFTFETTKVDNAGNFYIVGQFRGTLDIDLGPSVYNLTTVNSTSDEFFISKYDNDGNFIWAKKIQGYTYSVTVDNTGNIYLPFSNGISKLNSNGDLIWHKNLSMDQWDSVIYLDTNNNIFLTGLFVGTKDFDPSSNVHNLTSIGYDDIFVLKLDNDGNFNWVKQIKSNNMSWTNSIATDGSGNVYITGDYTSTLDFETNDGTFQLPFETGESYPRYILKLDASGNFVWAKKIGGEFENTSNSIAVDVTGNVYLSDGFYYTIDVDPNSGVYNISNLTGAGNLNSSFLLKLDTNGNFVWVNQYDRKSMVTVDLEGNVYTRGSTNYVQFPGNMTKYDTNGTILWTLNNAPGKFMNIDANGGIFVSGSFNGTYDFDPTSNIFNLTTATETPFIQKLNQPFLSYPQLPEIENQVSIFPNPTRGIINIKTSFENLNYKITDVNGKLLSEDDLNIIKSIDCSNYPNGLYFVTLKNENFNKTYKFVKQ